MCLADYLQKIANGSELVVQIFFLYMKIIEGEYQDVTFTPDSWHSLCGINLPLMPGILLNRISIRAIKSPLDNLRYVMDDRSLYLQDFLYP